MGPSRVYNPMNGEEVKAFVLKRVAQAFDEVADFRASIAFPVVRMDFKCVLSVYPRDPQDITVQATGAHVATDATPHELTNTTDIILEGQDAIGAAGMMSAEEARTEASLPIPTLRRDPRTGQLVDVMVESKTEAPPEESWTRGRSAIIDKGRNRLKT